MKTPSILASMVIAIAVVTALIVWNELREADAALADFARGQTSVALALSVALRGQLAREPAATPAQLLDSARSVEQPGQVRVLLSLPGQSGLLDSDGQLLRSARIEGALGRAGSRRLSHAEAAAVGLPPRTAMAGFSPIDTPRGRFAIVVAATAQAERDRELHSRWRLVLAVVLASSLVLAFGGLAMRKQRRSLELAHELDLVAARSERQDRLVRADKLATMGALASGIAHEVSTPLGVILGRAEQLLPRQTDERGRRAVQTIAEQTERIDAVIRGFLLLARGKEPALEQRDPAALARAAMDLCQHRFEKASVALRGDIAAGLPKISCEPRLFEQVLVNLLLNACDACASGGTVNLAVAALPKEVAAVPEEAAGQVAFTVTDDGVGISAEDAERIFEPFFTTKPAGKGSGLGLAIAGEIVKHHRGELAIVPRKDGRGTRATVALPVAAAAAQEVASAG